MISFLSLTYYPDTHIVNPHLPAVNAFQGIGGHALDKSSDKRYSEVERLKREKTMPESYRVTARVVRQEGTCSAGHAIGDEFDIGDETPAGMCSWAFSALFPFAMVLRFGGSFPWENDPDVATVACPDPGNPLSFELRRVRN
ncbi:TIGR04076 family protein [Chloroflexota bacterium]